MDVAGNRYAACDFVEQRLRAAPPSDAVQIADKPKGFGPDLTAFFCKGLFKRMARIGPAGSTRRMRRMSNFAVQLATEGIEY